MAGDSKDIELRIRARDYSQKTLDELVDTLNDLIAAQQQQQQAAKRGEASAKELEASYRKLENAAKALLSQHALTKTFQAQARALEEAKARTEEARQAQREYEQSLRGVDVLTKKQESTQNKLANAVAKAERAQQRAEDRLASTAKKLRGYGIETDNLAAAQSRIANAVAVANDALERQDRALDTIEDDLRRARQAAEAKARAERELARAAEEAAKAAAAQEAAQRKATEQAEAERKAQEELRAALNLAADEAVATAKGYAVLASSIHSLRGDAFAKSIREIIDPSGEAIKNMDGIESAVTRLEARVKSIRGPIKNYRQELNDLRAVQASLSNVAGLIDAYRRQEEAVGRAEAQYRAAHGAVRSLIDQMRAGQGTVSDLNRKMREAQNTLKGAALELRNQRQEAQRLREELRAAGISVDDLAAAEERVTNAARRAATATGALTTAYRRYGAEVKRADAAVRAKWFTGGRTTLSWMERVRGELLAITTAYVGLQGAIDLAKGALEAYRQAQAIESRLSILVGNDAKAIRQEWEYLRAQADRLGFGFETLAMDYSKFGISAKAAGLTLQETRYIFERMAEASRGARLSTEDFGGIMKALEQMLGKGTVQAEELRQQLGDRLPGAFAMAARGAGMTIEEFTKAMEKGEISAEYVINLAREAGETYKTAFEQSAQSMAAAEGRLQSAIFDFKLAIAENGFVDAYTNFITDLTELLKSEQGAELAKGLSEVFTAVVDAMRWCAENVELVKMAFAAFLALQVGGLIMRWVPKILALAGGVRKLFAGMSQLVSTGKSVTGLFKNLGKGATAGASGVSKMSKAVRLLGLAARTALRFVPVLGAALTAWEVYNWITSKTDDAKKAGKELGEAAKKGFEEAVATEDPGTGGTQSERVRKAILKSLEAEDARTSKMDVRTRQKSAKDELDERLKIAAEPFEALKRQAEQFITDEKKRADTLAAIDESLRKRLDVERAKFAQEQAARDSKSADRRRRIAEEVAMELERIEDDIAKRQAMQDPTAPFEERMRARLDAIAHEYDRLLRKINEMEKFDAKGAANARARVQEYIKQRQEVEALKVQQEELRRLENELNRQVSLRTNLLSALEAQYEAGLLSQEEYRRQVQQINDEMSIGIDRAGQALRTFAQTYEKLLDPTAYQELMARIDAVMAKNNGAHLNQQARLRDAEADLNRLLAERERILDAIRQKYALGLISESEMVSTVNATNGRFRESIIAATQEVIAYAQAIRNPANAEAIDTLIAKMQSLQEQTRYARQEFTQLDSTIVNSVANNGTQAFEDMGKAMGEMLLGQQSLSDGFEAMGVAAARFFAQLLRDIAQAIIRMMILKALQNSGIPGVSAAAGAAAAGQLHSGGLVGRGGHHTRRIDPSWFAGAQRFHSGGLPGLQPGEVPIIAQKGEEVLARDDPRNILNGGGTGNQTPVRFVLVDDRSKVAEAMASAEGERVTMVHLRRNIPTIRQMLRG